MTAKIVIASAAAVDGRPPAAPGTGRGPPRSACPAWPIPIQNTKVVMYIAHICGVRLPAAPMPTQIWYAQARMPRGEDERRPRTSRRSTCCPAGRSVRRTSRLTSAKVGSARGAAGSARRCALMRAPSRAGAGSAAHHLLQIGHARAACRARRARGSARGECDELGHRAALVLQVAEGDGLGRARLLAGRLDVAVAHRRASRRARGPCRPRCAARTSCTSP